MRDFLGLFGGVFNKTIILLALVGYEMIIANSALLASLAIYRAYGVIVNYTMLSKYGKRMRKF